MGRFSPANRPQAIYDPLADTLGNIFQEFRDTPIRQEEMRRRVLENLQREIDIAGRDLRLGAEPERVAAEASVVEGPGRRVGEGPASSFDFGTPPFTDVEPDPRVLRPRGRTAIGGEGLELAGPVPVEGKPTEAERRQTFDALPAMFTAGDVRGIMASPEETLAQLQELMGGRNELPFTEGSVGQFTGRERAAAEIRFREQERARQLGTADMERKVAAVMDAAAAQGNPISRAEAVAEVEGLDVPEAPQQPFEEEGFASEADYLAFLKRKAEATRAPPRATGTGAAGRLRRANNYAASLMAGDPNMTLEEAGSQTFEALGVAPDLATVRKIRRGGGSGEGEVPLNENEAIVKGWFDSGMSAVEIDNLIDSSPSLSDTDKHGLKRYNAELHDRNMPTAPKAAGRDFAAEAVATVEERRGNEPAEVGGVRSQVDTARDELREDTLFRILEGKR
jgi:hypothetical protein